MLFRSPVVRFFSRILNRVTITVVLVALQLLWLCWVAFAITTGTGRVWVNGLLNALSLLIVLYLVRKDENSAYKVGWIALIGILPLLGGALYLAFGNKRPAKRLRLKMQAVEDAHKKDQLEEHQAQGRALAILGMVEMEHPTLLYHPDTDADEHQPYEPGRGEMVYKMAHKPADALGAGKRMGERLGHRSCKQPRNQNHHYLGYSQR